MAGLGQVDISDKKYQCTMYLTLTTYLMKAIFVTVASPAFMYILELQQYTVYVIVLPKWDVSK